MEGDEENITIGGERFSYSFPSVADCNSCHLPGSGDILGFRTHQLNRNYDYSEIGGVIGNQLETFAQLGFIPNVNTGW